MAGTQRAGNNSWWTTITDLSLAAQATAADLYTNGINRLSDRSVWLLNQLTGIRADLAQTTAGTRATVVGSVDLSGLTYDSVIGTLNGLTLQTQADTGGVITTTFGTGGSAPTGPADVVSAIAAAAGSAQAIAEDSAGHLNASSSTTGSGSTINIVGGTAVTALGFTVAQNATGVSSGNDGVSRVSGASIVGSQGTIPAGTLRSMLTWIANRVPSGTITRAEPSALFEYSNSPPYPILNGFAAIGAVGDELWQMLTIMPNGSSLTSVSFYIKPDAHGSLPQNRPWIQVNKVNIVTGVNTSLLTGNANDSSVNTTAYDAQHAIVAPISAGNGAGGTSETIDRTQYVYYVTFKSESGTNSDNNTAPFGATVTYTV